MNNRPDDAVQSNFEVRILYRDERLLAVSKPSGLIVHRGFANDQVTLADIVRDQIIQAPVHAIHRLDRSTSGIVLFALDADMARELQKQLAEEVFEKRYLALVRGPMRFSGTLDHAVRDRETKERIPAVTEFIPLAHSGRWSVVEARPRTGRTHQIRLHLKHLSHPIVGDVRYGKGDVNRLFREEYNLHRLALHACQITLGHPSNRKLTLRDPLPSDLQKVFDTLNIGLYNGTH